MTGVMPDPPLIIRSRSRLGVAGLPARVNSPSAWLRWSTCPGRASATRNRETLRRVSASSWARTVIVKFSPGADAAEEIEKQRVVLREPAISTPTWTYWPARCPRQELVGCRVSVATGCSPAVSWWIPTMRARTSWAAHIGFTCSR